MKVMIIIAALLACTAVSLKVKVSSCNCSDCPVQEITYNQCTFNNITQSYEKIDCDVGKEGVAQMCFIMHTFDDDKCQKRNDLKVRGCGYCQAIGSGYVLPICSVDESAVYLLTCDDVNCKNCAAKPLKFPRAECANKGIVTGLQPCNVVRMESYANDEKCQKLNAVKYLPESSCLSRSQRRFKCEIQKYLKSPETVGVSKSKCRQTASTYDKFFQSKMCVSSNTPGESLIITCEEKQEQCVRLSYYTSKNCDMPSFNGTMSPVCDKCFLWEGKYFQYDCSDNGVVFKGDCDNTCTKCEKIAKHPNFMCSPSAIEGHSIFALGKFPCLPVSANKFKGDACQEKAVGHYEVAQGTCSGGSYYQCRSMNDTVRITNCGCPSCKQDYTFDQRCTEATYAHDPEYPYSRFKCGQTPSTCVQLAVYKDEKCETYEGGVSLVCGTCSLLDNKQYTKVECTAEGQVAKVLMDCDADCSVCKGANVPINVDKCTKFIDDLYIYSQGLMQCSSIQLSMFKNDACTAESKSVTLPQDECFGEKMFSCFTQPTIVTVTGGLIEHRRCKTARCKDCEKTTYRDGECLKRYKRVGSVNRTCNALSSRCAEIVIHNNTKTCNRFQDVESIVCNSCIKSLMGDGSWWHVMCDEDTEDIVYVTSCNKDCSECKGDKKHHIQDTCIAFENNTKIISIFLRTLTTCATITSKFYLSDDCKGDMEQEITHAQGICTRRGTIQCVRQPPSPSPKKGGMSNGAKAAIAIIVALIIAAIIIAIILLKAKGSNSINSYSSNYRPMDMNEPMNARHE